MLSVDDQFNLLISCRRFQEAESCYELQRISDEEADLESIDWCKMTGISCLVVAKIAGDPHNYITQIAKIVKRTPWAFRELLKIEPIDLVVETNLEAIRAGAKELASRMSKSAKFRINLNRRNTNLDRKKLLHEVAIQFPGKVDLEEYELICTVEILGPVTGLALIRKEEIVTLRRP